MRIHPRHSIINAAGGGKAFASYLAAASLVALTIGVAVVFRRLPHANTPLLFLTVVLVIAARWGLWPSIFASLLSFLALNFFFTEPFYTFAVAEQGDVATLLLFLAMAGLTGNLAARMRTETANSRAALERVSALLDFSRRMAGAPGAQQALQALVDRLSQACRTHAVALRPDDQGRLCKEAETNIPHGQEGLGMEHANDAWNALLNGRSPRIPGWTALPLAAGEGVVGLAAVKLPALDPERRALAHGLCDQASIAVERATLVDSLKTAQLVSETERLRSALLSSVSHDLRTPLVSIIGSTTSLLEYREVLKPEARRELLQTTLDEAQRLNRYIQNLLDMTRFGQQPFELRREWADLNDLISSATERLGSTLTPASLDVRVAPEVALLKVHGALIEQVLVNLLDNAAGFAQDPGTISVRAYRRESSVIVDVINDGPRIPDDEREKIFDMFYRAAQTDRQRPGAGLGLAICRSIVTAHGGTIEARSGPGGTGALLRIDLPIAANPTETMSHSDEHPDHRGRLADPEVSADQP